MSYTGISEKPLVPADLIGADSGVDYVSPVEYPLLGADRCADITKAVGHSLLRSLRADSCDLRVQLLFSWIGTIVATYTNTQK